MIDEILRKYSDVLKQYYRQVSKSKQSDLFGWASKYSQVERFRVIVGEAQKYLGFNEHDTLLDVGCGHADLYKYMIENHIKVKYSGIDFFPQFVSDTKKRYPAIRTRMFDILNPHNGGIGYYDIMCMSGVLNLNVSDIVKRDDANLLVVDFLLARLLKSCNKGLVCNFLHEKSSDKDDFFVYHNPHTLISHLEMQGYKVLHMREDYLPNDFTLTVVRKDNAVARTEEAPLHIFTDGGCSGNPGKGAWAYYVENTGDYKSGHVHLATNNQMELTATIECLKWASQYVQRELHIYTDSQYVKNGITQWINTWKRTSWHTTARTPVKNQTLWKELDTLSSSLNVHWHWVKGHAENVGNEKAHELVAQELQSLK